MPSLKQIQINKQNKLKEMKKIKENYKSPPSICLIMEYLKIKNKLLIKEFLTENNYDEKYYDILIKKFLLLSNYSPTIVQKKKKEKLQCI